MKIKAKKINEKDFSKFGTFLDPYNVKSEILKRNCSFQIVWYSHLLPVL